MRREAYTVIERVSVGTSPYSLYLLGTYLLFLPFQLGAGDRSHVSPIPKGHNLPYSQLTALA